MEEKIEKLKGHRLGNRMRKSLWCLRGGKINQDGELEYHHIKFKKDNRSYFRKPQPYSTKEIARRTMKAKKKTTRDKKIKVKKVTKSEKTSTYRALRKLEELGLVESRDDLSTSPFHKPKQEKRWELTDLGLAVVNVYEIELAEGKRIKWNEERVKRFL